MFSRFQPFLCQAFYTLIEYGKTAMFLWMFIEGIILYHMTNVAFSRGPEDQKKFYYSGWREYCILIRCRCQNLPRCFVYQMDHETFDCCHVQGITLL